MEEDFRKKFPTAISYPLEMIELAKEAHDEFESYYLYVDFFDGGRLVEVGRGKKWVEHFSKWFDGEFVTVSLQGFTLCIYKEKELSE